MTLKGSMPVVWFASCPVAVAIHLDAVAGVGAIERSDTSGSGLIAIGIVGRGLDSGQFLVVHP